MNRQPVDINKIIADKGISATAARVFDVVHRLVCASANTGRRDRRGIPYCYASKERIAEMIGKSKRTVDRAIAELKAAGMLEGQRTTHNGRLFVTYYGINGTSGSANNGTSIYRAIENNNQVRMSFNHSTYTQGGQTDSAPGMAQAAPRGGSWSEGGQVSTRTISTASAQRGRKTGPTNKRPGIDRAARAAAKRRYARQLEQRLHLDSLMWAAPGFEAEAAQLSQLVDVIAEAVSNEAGIIRANGCGLTAAQYWEAVKDIEIADFYGLFDKVNEAYTTKGVHNRRAYLLAAVYNAVTVDRLYRAAS